MTMNRIRGLAASCLTAAGLFLTLSDAATAQSVAMNLADVLPDGNFMVTAEKQFAERVAEATEGRVNITVLAGGALGFKGPELLTAVRDGLVPMANMPGVQQNGEDRIFDTEGLPFLVNNQEELAELHVYLRPAFDEVAAKYNQKFLYLVPTPSQYLYTNVEVDRLDGLANLKARAGDKSGVDVLNALGLAGIFMPWGEVIPALASKRVDAVLTSATSAVDGRFWEFLKYIYLVNGTGLSHIVTINLDAWDRISEADQATMLAIADELQPEFWALSAAQGTDALKVLQENGMEIVDYPATMRDDMLSRTRPLLDQKLADMPSAQPIVAEYLKAVGR
ncbi:MAG: TRAP transporter substrate-binding protein [Tropicimonas sp.]|uniref:TRAP transporter substrate-binding protein n=1 Tax=Tropicimonas sp. TaxID=2067044 RepID=UPI003A85A679